MKYLFALAAGAVFFSFFATTAMAAGTSAEPKVRVIHDTPDSAKGEVSRVKEVSLLDNKLVRITLNYKDGRHKIQNFTQGKLFREVEQTRDGTLRTTRYSNDKVVELQLTKNGSVELRGFREDGTRLYTTVRSPRTEPVSNYYGKDGFLRLTRTMRRTGQMHVTVFDKSGKELYKQTWVSGIAGYVLISVEEKTAMGTRRLNVRGGKAATADYLKADGTVERTEKGDALSEPVDDARLIELDAQDDPTMPRPRQR